MKSIDVVKLCVMATIVLCNGMMFLFLISYLHQQQPAAPFTPANPSPGLQDARLTLMHDEIKQLREELLDMKRSIVNTPLASPVLDSNSNSPPKPEPSPSTDSNSFVSPADFVQVANNLFPFNTSLFDEYTSPIVDPERKVIFCWMAKNSCSKFKRLFAYAAQGWNPLEKISMIKFDHQIHEHHELFRQLNAYPQSDVNEMINSENWKKVAFVRDPLERWLSAFSEKCRTAKKNPADNNPCFGKSVKEFIGELHEHYVNLDACGNADSDSHFFPQWCECDLWKDHEKWSVYRFDRKNRGEQIDHFLNNFGYKDYLPMFQTSTSHRTKSNKTQLMNEIENNPKTKKQLLTLLERDYRIFFPDLWPPI